MNRALHAAFTAVAAAAAVLAATIAWLAGSPCDGFDVAVIFGVLFGAIPALAVAVVAGVAGYYGGKIASLVAFAAFLAAVTGCVVITHIPHGYSSTPCPRFDL